MPKYCLRLRSADHFADHEEWQELPNLSEAMAAACRAALTLIHKRPHGDTSKLRGTMDVEDEARRPVARILLVDLAYQLC